MGVLFAVPAFLVGLSMLIQAFADPEPFINVGRFICAAVRRKHELGKRLCTVD
jgi:hypothetical protein